MYNLKSLSRLSEKLASIFLQTALRDAQGGKLVNSTDSNYNTALHLAAAAGNIGAVRELLAHPSTFVDSKNEFKKTPTHLAASQGHAS